MHKFTVFVILTVLVATVVLDALDSDKAAYIGGTHEAYIGAKDAVEGKLNTGIPTALVLSPEAKSLRGNDLTIPYDKVLDLEYGQKAGRRVGLAVGLAVVNPVALGALFSKEAEALLDDRLPR